MVCRLSEALKDCDVYYDGELCADLERALKDDSSATKASAETTALMRNFSALAVIDASSTVNQDGAFDFDQFVQHIGSRLAGALRLPLPPEKLHHEEVAQLLKDEKRVLFCFLSVGLLSGERFQRLRGLGFTQTDHRILFCGHSDVLHAYSTRLTRVCDAGRAVELGSELAEGKEQVQEQVENAWREERIARLREILEPEERTLLILRVDRALPWSEIAHILADQEGVAPSEAALRKRFEGLKKKLGKAARDAGLID